MDSNEWNKIIGSVLGTVLFVVAVHIASQAVYYAPPPAKPAYNVPGVEAKTETPTLLRPPRLRLRPISARCSRWPTRWRAPQSPSAARLVTTGRKDGPNKIGPNLFGVVGRPKASHPGFDYSAAMKAKGGDWSYPDLFNFLRQPAVFAPGTKMSFAGLPRPQDRLNVIAFLRTQADTPAPLPPRALHRRLRN